MKILLTGCAGFIGSHTLDRLIADDHQVIGSLHYEGSNYEIINLGNDQTVTLSEMIATIEEVVGKKAIIDRLPEQPGDVPQTWADISKAGKLFGYKQTNTFKVGVSKFNKWQKAQSSF